MTITLSLWAIPVILTVVLCPVIWALVWIRKHGMAWDCPMTWFVLGTLPVWILALAVADFCGGAAR